LTYDGSWGARSVYANGVVCAETGTLLPGHGSKSGTLLSSGQAACGIDHMPAIYGATSTQQFDLIANALAHSTGQPRLLGFTPAASSQCINNAFTGHDGCTLSQPTCNMWGGYVWDSNTMHASTQMNACVPVCEAGQ
jgi:hypothetical protein